jgi:hypothetical protein
MPKSPLTKGKYFQFGTYTGSFLDAFVLGKDQLGECTEKYGGSLPRTTDIHATLYLGILRRASDAAGIRHFQVGTQAIRHSQSGTGPHSGLGTFSHSGLGTSSHSGYGTSFHSGLWTSSHSGLRRSFHSGLRISFHSGLSNNSPFRIRDKFPFRFSPRREESTGPSDAFPVGSSQDSFSVYTPESASSIKRVSSAPATFEQALAEQRFSPRRGKAPDHQTPFLLVPPKTPSRYIPRSRHPRSRGCHPLPPPLNKLSRSTTTLRTLESRPIRSSFVPLPLSSHPHSHRSPAFLRPRTRKASCHQSTTVLLVRL